MLIALFIYLAEVVSNLKSIFIVLSIIEGILLIIILSKVFTEITTEDLETNDIKHMLSKMYFGEIFTVFSIFTILYLITPQEKTMYMMAGAYLGTEIITNKIVSDKLDKVNKIIDFKLDEIIKEYEKGE